MASHAGCPVRWQVAALLAVGSVVVTAVVVGGGGGRRTRAAPDQETPTAVDRLHLPVLSGGASGEPVATRRATDTPRSPTIEPSTTALATTPFTTPTPITPSITPVAPTPTPIASSPTPAAPPPANECAQMAPDWVFCDAFETGAEWDGSVTNPVTIADPGPFGGADNHVARLRVPAGPGGNGLWKKLPESDRLYARWFVQWEPGHDLTARHHGPGGLGADVSWYTGRSGIRPNGDEYFVSTLEASTQAPFPMSAYTYSRGMYMDCADPNGRCWGDLFPCYAGPRYCTQPQHLPRVEQAGITTGRWYCLEQMIDAGTPVQDASDADGELDFWIDGVEIGPWTDLWWRIGADAEGQLPVAVPIPPRRPAQRGRAGGGQCGGGDGKGGVWAVNGTRERRA